MNIVTKYILFLSATAFCAYLICHDLFVGHRAQALAKHIGLFVLALFVDIKYLWVKTEPDNPSSSLFGDDDNTTS